MGNRAILKPINSTISVYLHWNGGIDSVTAFLKYCELKQYRPFGGKNADGYGIARFCQVVGNFFGDIGYIKIMPSGDSEKDAEGLNNGIYIIDGWSIARTVGKQSNGKKDLVEMLIAIDNAQPEAERLGEAFLTAEEVSVAKIKVGDKVFCYEGCIYGQHPELYTVEEIAPKGTFADGGDVSGLPKIRKYDESDGNNYNNYLMGINGKLRRARPEV